MTPASAVPVPPPHHSVVAQHIRGEAGLNGAVEAGGRAQDELAGAVLIEQAPKTPLAVFLGNVRNIAERVQQSGPTRWRSPTLPRRSWGAWSEALVHTPEVVSDRAATFGEALLPSRVVYHRLARRVRENGGRWAGVSARRPVQGVATGAVALSVTQLRTTSW